MLLRPFTDEDLVVVMEAARLALEDYDMCEGMGLSDAYSSALLDKIHEFLTY